MSKWSPYPPERTTDLGGEQVLPLFAPRHRTDPRPPTVRSVRQDLANQIWNAARGDPAVARFILKETIRGLDELAYVGATSGFRSQKEPHTAALLLMCLKDYVTGPPAPPPSGGTGTVAQATSANAIAAALHSTEVEQERLVKAAMELTGLSRAMWTNGKETAQRMTRHLRSKFGWAERGVAARTLRTSASCTTGSTTSHPTWSRTSPRLSSASASAAGVPLSAREHMHLNNP